MGAVAFAATAETWASLEARGCTITLVSLGFTAPKVTVSAPEEAREALSEALAWRMASMRAMYRPGLTRALVAAEGPFARGRCGSCGEAYQRGDCPLCNAARVGVLRSLGVLPPAAPRVDPYDRSRIERHAERLGELPEPKPLDRTSPHWWACEKGHDNWGLRASGCGPCEAARFGFVDLSGLAGGRIP